LSGPAILLAVDDRDVETMITALNTPDVLFSVAFRVAGLENARTDTVGSRWRRSSCRRGNCFPI
jgi:hypothetical protein